MVTAVLVAIGEAVLVWWIWRAWRRATQRARQAEEAYAAVMKELREREADRARLEADLARLREGSPADRVGASLDVLRDVSAATGAAPDSVAGTPAPARRNRGGR